MEVMLLLSRIEQEYSIRISERAIRTFVNVQDIVDYVLGRIVEKG